MPFFTELTKDELRKYLMTKPLAELERLNHQYGEDIYHLENQIEIAGNKINTLNASICKLQQEIACAKAEAERRENYRLEALQEGFERGAEGQLARNALSFSYITDFQEFNTAKNLKIGEFQAEIRLAEQIKTNSELKKRLNVTELKILNFILDKKRAEGDSKAPLENGVAVKPMH
jgi:hypothetical protein